MSQWIAIGVTNNIESSQRAFRHAPPYHVMARGSSGHVERRRATRISMRWSRWCGLQNAMAKGKVISREEMQIPASSQVEKRILPQRNLRPTKDWNEIVA